MLCSAQFFDKKKFFRHIDSVITLRMRRKILLRQSCYPSRFRVLAKKIPIARLREIEQHDFEKGPSCLVLQYSDCAVGFQPISMSYGYIIKELQLLPDYSPILGKQWECGNFPECPGNSHSPVYYSVLFSKTEYELYNSGIKFLPRDSQPNRNSCLKFREFREATSICEVLNRVNFKMNLKFGTKVHFRAYIRPTLMQKLPRVGGI